MLEQAIADLTVQVTELNRLMAQLVASTADAVEAAPKRTRKAKPEMAADQIAAVTAPVVKPEPAAENPTPTAPSAPAAEAPTTAQPTEPSPASHSEQPPFTPDPTPTQSGASTGDATPLDLHLKVKTAAMRLAAATSKERVMALIKDKYRVTSLAAIPDAELPGVLALLEGQLAKAQQGLKEAA